MAGALAAAALVCLAIRLAAVGGEGPAGAVPTSAAAQPASALVDVIPTVATPPPAAVWPDAQGAEVRPETLTDETVNRAIRGGCEFLLGQFSNGRLALGDDPNLSRAWRDGLDALCVYALLRAGQVTRDERLTPRGRFVPDALDKLDGAELETDVAGHWGPVTYGRALRAMTLAVYDRPEDRPTLQQDAVWLVNAQVIGGYFYDDRYALRHARRSDLPGAPSPQSEQPRRVGPADAPPRIVVVPGSALPNAPKPSPPPAPTGWKAPIVWPSPPKVVIVHPVQLPPQPPVRLPPPSSISLPRPTPSKSSKPGPSAPGSLGTPPVDIRSIARPLPADTNPPLKPEEVPWDNSNSQYGMLGVLACAERGIEIPSWYWKNVEYHWLRWQMKDGGWAYRPTDAASTLAMTSAGVTAVLASADWAGQAAGQAMFGRDPFTPSVAAGVRWLEFGDNAVALGAAGSRFVSYDLFNLERAGSATGLKYFGNHAWYRELAAGVIGRQQPDGSWGAADRNAGGAQDRLIETAYALLFLARGQHPVLFNKLRFDGSWANHYRDAANLASYASAELERGINWQVVDLQRDWTDWLDSPVLYIASHQPPKLTDADIDKLRQFAEAGGVLFMNADGDSPAVNQWVAQLAKKLWPDYPLRPLAEDHPIYSVQAKLAGRPHPKLEAVSNGSRLLLVHSPVDLAATWQMRATKTRPVPFQMGLNLFLYADGKSDAGYRLDGSYLPAPAGAPKQTVKVARLKYNGTWDPEPLAWTRFSRWLQARTGTAVECITVDATALRPEDAPLAHLTATSACELDAPAVAALHAYVEAGGVLLVDPCGGGEDVGRSLHEAICHSAFASAKFEPVVNDDPILQSNGASETLDLSVPVYRSYVLSKAPAPPAGIPIDHAAVGKGHVYVSRVDLTSGLLGTRAWGINGFDPEYASSLVRNLLLRAGMP